MSGKRNGDWYCFAHNWYLHTVPKKIWILVLKTELEQMQRYMSGFCIWPRNQTCAATTVTGSVLMWRKLLLLLVVVELDDIWDSVYSVTLLADTTNRNRLLSTYMDIELGELTCTVDISQQSQFVGNWSVNLRIINQVMYSASTKGCTQPGCRVQTRMHSHSHDFPPVPRDAMFPPLPECSHEFPTV